ncbi:Protein O-linked-mannose beta-1,4-N-acetylglucosaminyltransferase [Quillaja saponaria]|uniref:Protein O-linked-mannose beta-1,4-N-acetylglucosaminyltransferase n=1 Tax=Quillaja saponaria TaxID=32244 RepID=A0AAD7KVU4_QUISA|nr:Protein O-linked-mannose beta-1,4-N-acetylglucosaminyltransferase [Quillaja saponaria]
MSSMYDTHKEGEVQYQHFPSESSQGRLLCFKGRDNHDGSWNSYALAWPEALPYNATFMKGLTFVSYNHYDYGNIWHGISAVMPFVAWHIKANCSIPSRWILYHWGELRLNMALWLKTLMEATFDGPPYIESLDYDGVDEGVPVCFEEAVVMRHNEGGMSREKRMEVYDLMRCKARMYCNLSLINDRPEIGFTLLTRTGARAFRNESVVVEIFQKECAKVDGCRLNVAHSNNLTFCEQVKANGVVRHFSIRSWCSINQHVPNGQKQQCHGVVPQGLA